MTHEQILQLCQDMKGETLRNRLADNLAYDLIESMEEIDLSTGENLFSPGSQNNDIYVLARGILRLYYMNKGKDSTFAFGLPGTFFPRINTLNHGLPSQLGCAACCRGTLVLHSTYADFEAFMQRHSEMAWWWIELLENQIYDLENSFILKNGDARTRFRALMKDRPVIIKECPATTIASYLGITPSYLSTLRHEWALEPRE